MDIAVWSSKIMIDKKWFMHMFSKLEVPLISRELHITGVADNEWGISGCRTGRCAPPNPKYPYWFEKIIQPFDAAHSAMDQWVHATVHKIRINDSWSTNPVLTHRKVLPRSSPTHTKSMLATSRWPPVIRATSKNFDETVFNLCFV